MDSYTLFGHIVGIVYSCYEHQFQDVPTKEPTDSRLYFVSGGEDADDAC